MFDFVGTAQNFSKMKFCLDKHFIVDYFKRTFAQNSFAQTSAKSQRLST